MKASIIILLLCVATVVGAQTKEEKISFITRSYFEKDGWLGLSYNRNIVEGLLYYHPTTNDSLKLIELKATLSDKDEMNRRLSKHLVANFSDEAIDSLYYNYNQEIKPNSTNEKNSTIHVYTGNESAYIYHIKNRLANFIPNEENEIQEIQSRIRAAYQKQYPNEPRQKAIRVNKQDGFYTVKNYKVGTFSLSDLQLSADPAILASDIQTITKDFDILGRAILSIQFNAAGTKNFKALSEKNKGKPIALVLHHKILLAPVINEPIATGNVEINGNFSDEKIDEIINYKKKYR